MTDDPIFWLKESGEHPVPVLGLCGELDIASTEQLRELFIIYTQTEPELLVLDLSELTFIDSTGISVLIVGLRRFRELGADLHLAAAQPQIQRVFEVAGIIDLFPMYPDVASAKFNN